MFSYNTQTDSYIQNRLPIVATFTLTTAEKHLYELSTAESAEPWAIKCDAAWLCGEAGGASYPVAANVAFAVPSKTLSGWYAKAATGTTGLALIGAARVTEGVT
jgi:hypothetical protein